jgi:large-conductance mechanosensitive channel
MKFDHKKVFDGFKQLFVPQMTHEQTSGLEFLITSFEQDAIWSDVRYIAYALATVWHETAYTFQPIQEFGGSSYFERRYGSHTKVGRRLGNDAPGEGAKYSGKGYVQLTGESNYEKLEDIIRKQNPEIVQDFERRSGQRFDLTDYAYQAKDPQLAFLIMTIGMFRGLYTGVAFRHYINNRETNYKEARRIINGTDKQIAIAGYAVKFEKILRAALVKESPKANPLENLLDAEINLEIPTTSAAPADDSPQDGPSDVPEKNLHSDSPATVEKQGETFDYASAPAPPKQNQSETEVEIKGGDVKVKTSENPGKPDKIAVEKPEPKNFIEKMWKKITGVFGGGAVTDVTTEKLAQVNALGLSYDFWKRIVYFAVAAGVIYLIVELVHHYQEVKRDKEITNELVKANSTESNKVVLVDKDNIEYFKARGYKIVYR